MSNNEVVGDNNAIGTMIILCWLRRDTTYFQSVYRDFTARTAQKGATAQTTLRAIPRTEDVVVLLAGEVADAIKVTECLIILSFWLMELQQLI